MFISYSRRAAYQARTSPPPPIVATLAMDKPGKRDKHPIQALC